MTLPSVYTATTAWNKDLSVSIICSGGVFTGDSLGSPMLNSLQMIAELLSVFAFCLLGLTAGFVVYALLQVCLQGVIGQREARNASGRTSAAREGRIRDSSTFWNTFSSSSHASTGFTRHAKQ